MKNDELKRKRLLKKAHKLADRADAILRDIVKSIKSKQQKAA
jgi:hypothetical protein